jgi:carboxymethylenebutenolidase
MRETLASGTTVEVALPEGPPVRGMVVIPDIAGLRPLFDDLAATLVAERHWAVAEVDPFPGLDLPTMDERFAAIPEQNDQRIIDDCVAAADLLAERTGVRRVGVLGYCLGGMCAYKAASSGRFDRAVTFYGMIRLPLAWRGPFQREPIDVIREPRTCPILSIIGDRDPYTPPEDVALLSAYRGIVTTVIFPDAEHGFVHDPSRPAHRPDDAADAWRQVAAFLE